MSKRYLIAFVCGMLFAVASVAMTPMLSSWAITVWLTDSNGVALTAFTGGTAGCVDQIDGDLLSDGDVIEVVWDSGNYKSTARYRVNASSSATESGIDNITPDTNPGTKRCELTMPPYCFGTVAPTNPQTWLLWVDTTIP